MAAKAELLAPAGSFESLAKQRNIKFSKIFAPDTRIIFDRSAARMLLSVLIDNAIKYCPEGGTLSVNLQKEGKTVLRIANTVSEKIADPQRFFDRFYRADSSRSRETGGYGIGLSAAQAIVRLHGGSISAAYEGEKIVFTVRLP